VLKCLGINFSIAQKKEEAFQATIQERNQQFMDIFERASKYSLAKEKEK